MTAHHTVKPEPLMELGFPSEGSVSGRLDRLNANVEQAYVLRPAVGEFTVLCAFPKELFERANAATGRTVTVFGAFVHKPGVPFPEMVQVKSIEIHPMDEALPKLSEMRGRWRGFTGGLSAAELLAASRDE